MARIRTIKPEFWDSPGTGRASLRARLFFIALWNWADDWGVGDGHPLRLLSFAFPNDESPDVEPRNFRLLASEVSKCFDVVWYQVDGRDYYQIPSWEQHQRTEKKAKRKNPPSDQAVSWLYDSASENPPLNRGLATDGTGEQGKGKGEEGSGKWEEKPLSDDESSNHGTLIPDNWQPNQQHIDKATSLHLDINREHQRFRSHAQTKQRRMKNWNAAFTNWLKQGAVMAQQHQRQPPANQPRMSKAAQNAEAYRKEFGADDTQGSLAAPHYRISP